MNSGIYKLTFSDGSFYVGQSTDIVARYNSHIASFRKGYASTKMLDAYMKYGLPECSVLRLCHPDYLDVIEAYYIKMLAPTLNTKIPVVDGKYFPDLTEKTLCNLEEPLDYLLFKLQEYNTEILTHRKRVGLYNKLKEKLRIYEDSDSAGLAAKCASLQVELDRVNGELALAQERLAETKPWYTRIF